MLLKVEHAWKSGLTVGNSPMSKECAWNKYGPKKKGVEPKRIIEMKWKKPQCSNKGMLIASGLVSDYSVFGRNDVTRFWKG